jgi:hypothetical protein
MSLSMNHAKIDELLTSNFVGSPSLCDTGNLTPWYASAVGGVVYSTPILVTEDTKEHLLSFRRKIEGAGIPLISGDELDSELREMRR